jgi:hypothetical protein
MHDDIERYSDEMFPSDYASWRYCIGVKCGQTLTPEFLRGRIAILSDPSHEASRRFTKLYGNPWRKQVLTWFQRAADEA